MREIPKKVIGGPDCPGCRRGYAPLDLRPIGYMCEKHGPCADAQVIQFEGKIHCLQCFKDIVGEIDLPELKKRKLEIPEFDGYHWPDGKFIKYREPKPELWQRPGESKADWLKRTVAEILAKKDSTEQEKTCEE